jgi:hypothetical protein
MKKEKNNIDTGAGYKSPVFSVIKADTFLQEEP